jgi:RND family efflux transporter MFP subunit
MLRSSRWALTPALIMIAAHAAAQGGGGPAQVVVAEAKAGRLVPTADFEGTVYYKEVSAVATEVEGKVLSVGFDVGDVLSAGDPLVTLNTDILEARLRAARAMLGQRQALLRQEQARFERAVLLVEEEITTDQEFDDIRFTRDAIEQQVEAARAEIALLELEISKKAVYAPFDGVVMQRHAEVGEWLSGGAPVATVARFSLYDVTVFVPERFLPFIQTGAEIELRILGEDTVGLIVPGAPDGDIATRTFPIRIRLTGPEWLQAGMAAIARMPTGNEQECVLVPRDAVLQESGLHYIVMASDGAANRIEVSVLGYEGDMAGLPPGTIEPGEQVIVKGHERLRTGQPIFVAGS